MADPDLNPYNFVPLAGEVERTDAPRWHRLEEGHLTGELVCDLEALTPLFTAHHQKARPVSSQDKRKIFPFLRTGQGVPMIQGATLRGMIRSVYEAAFTSCLPLAAPEGESRKRGAPVEYELVLPAGFDRCKDSQRLCPACRLFGVIEGEEVHVQGRVSFSDALLTQGTLHPGEIYLRELSSPKPHHYAIYSETGAEKGPIRGRKLFYHHDPGARAALGKESPEWTSRSNAIQEVAPAGARFTFRVRFSNLTQEELRRLAGCLLLDSGHAHKVGMARPQGFGSCRIHVVSSRGWQGADRYRSWERSEGPVPIESWTPAPAMLERILRHPGDRQGTVGYLPLNAYRGMGIDEEGRFTPVSPAGAKAPGARVGSPPPSSAPLAKLDFDSMPRARNPGKDRPVKIFKKGDKAKVVVLKVEVPGRRYVLHCKESGQDDIPFEAAVTWQEGEIKVVRVDSMEGGRIKSVKWP